MTWFATGGLSDILQRDGRAYKCGSGSGAVGWQRCDFDTLPDMKKQHYTNTLSTDFADGSP
jgi:hypothetical protein